MTDNCYYNIEDGLTNATLFLLIMRSSCQNWSCMGFKVQVLIFFETTSLLEVRLQLSTNFETSFIRCGVSQAQSSPPSVLFLLYIKVLPNCNLPSDVRMYADNTYLTYASKNPEELSLFSSLTYDLSNLKQ